MKLNGFYRAVIEDNNDPLKQGRVRVRVLGIHSAHREDIDIQMLPWAEYASSLFGSAEGNDGVSSIPKTGSWVWCFFDQGEITRPVYFAKIKNITSTDIGIDGFYDPNDIYPKQDYRDESEVNRLSRNSQKKNPIDELIKNDRTVLNKTIGTYGTTINISQNVTNTDKAIYPNNNVIQTPSGHIIELDDTVGNERIRIIHKSGSFFEINSNNDLTVKSMSDEYNIVKGNMNSIIEKSVQEYIKNNINRVIDGNVKEYIAGTSQEEVQIKKYTKVPQHTNVSDNVITGNLKVLGTIHATGGISSGADVQTSSISLNTHLHSGVTSGPSSTSTPNGGGGSTSASTLAP